MKIEHEHDDKRRRWSVEVDPWVDRTLVLLLAGALSGGAVLVGILRMLVG